MERPTVVKKQRVTLYLPADLVRRARHVGLDTGRSLSDLAREGLEKELDRLVPPGVPPEKGVCSP